MENENKSSTLLRTQSYIANGMASPKLNASKKDYLSNLIKNKYNKKPSNKSKPKTSKSKNYINDIKKQKKDKKASVNKTSQKKLLKKYINDKIDEKTEIINYKNNNNHSRNTFIYITKTEKFKNINENYLYTKTHHYKIKNKKESNGKENNKNTINIRDKKNYNNSSIFPNNELKKSNGFHKSSFYSNNLNDEYFSKTNKEKNNSKFEFANIVNQTKLGIMTTKAQMNRSRNKEFRKNIDKIYTMSYHSKKKKNPSSKVLTPILKDKNFVNKILCDENDDYLDIKTHKNKNILLNKLNYYTKREKIEFRDKNKTQKGLLTIKNLINRKSIMFSPKSTTNKIYNIPTKLFHYSYSNYKQYNNNCLNNANKKTNSKNNAKSQIITEYNIKYNKKNDCSSDLFKIKISKSLSNIINSIREQRKTNKFIKDLNKNNTFGNSSNKHIKFSFSPNKDEDSNDEFYSPNKSKINIVQFKESKKLSNNKKINYFIKKNISTDNYIRNTKKKNKNIYNVINIRNNNFINGYKEKKHFVMPANEAIN